MPKPQEPPKDDGMAAKALLTYTDQTTPPPLFICQTRSQHSRVGKHHKLSPAGIVDLPFPHLPWLARSVGEKGLTMVYLVETIDDASRIANTFRSHT